MSDKINPNHLERPAYVYICQSTHCYAGAFAHGQREARTVVRDGRAHTSHGHRKALEQWDGLILDHHPGYISWAEYLKQRGWTMPMEVVVPLRRIPKYERIAAKVQELAARGASPITIARATGHTYETVRQALEYARTGRRPKTRPPGKRTGARTGPPKYITLAGEVARLRDEGQLSFEKIARKLGVSVDTAKRAYDGHHVDQVRDAAERGRTPQRGRYSHLGPETYARIRATLRDGERPQAIAAAVGCSVQTVYRVRREMRSTASEGGGTAPGRSD